MARNQEKAQAMLNRLLAKKREMARPVEQQRPFLAEECTVLHEAERWRAQVLKEIQKEVNTIQNGALGEHRIRDLNDHINKLLREKTHWERQIKLLGGPDYAAMAPKVVDADGATVMGDGGYLYFGAARELPGVRELFEKQASAAPKRTRYELFKMVDADYYGYRDDDDGKLVKLERKQEKKAVVQAVAEWKAMQIESKKLRHQALGLAPPSERELQVYINTDGEDDLFKAHVALPSQQEIEAIVLAQKKKELLRKYAMEEAENEQAAKEAAEEATAAPPAAPAPATPPRAAAGDATPPRVEAADKTPPRRTSPKSQPVQSVQPVQEEEEEDVIRLGVPPPAAAAAAATTR